MERIPRHGTPKHSPGLPSNAMELRLRRDFSSPSLAVANRAARGFGPTRRSPCRTARRSSYERRSGGRRHSARRSIARISECRTRRRHRERSGRASAAPEQKQTRTRWIRRIRPPLRDSGHCTELITPHSLPAANTHRRVQERRQISPALRGHTSSTRSRFARLPFWISSTDIISPGFVEKQQQASLTALMPGDRSSARPEQSGSRRRACPRNRRRRYGSILMPRASHCRDRLATHVRTGGHCIAAPACPGGAPRWSSSWQP
jgi:hypothetical protein